MVVKSGHYDRLLTKNNFHLGFITDKYLVFYHYIINNYIVIHLHSNVF